MRFKSTNIPLRLLTLICAITFFGEGFLSQAGAAQVKLLNRGYDSLAAHVAAIQTARLTIDILAYEIRPCDPGIGVLLRALAASAGRGVRVRMIVDGMGLKPDVERLLSAFFQAHRMELKVFNSQGPVVFKNNRNHAKLFVIDKDLPTGIYFADGRNLTDSYFGFGNIGMNYIGRDLVIEDPIAVSQAANGFDDIRNRGLSQPVSIQGTPKDLVGSCLTQEESWPQRLLRQAAIIYVSSLPTYTCGEINYYLDKTRSIYTNRNEIVPKITDGPNPKVKFSKGSPMFPARLAYKKSSRATLDFILGTKTTLNMENQYYLPTFELWDALRSVAKRASVLIFTNMKPDTGNAAANAAMSYQTRLRVSHDRDREGIRFLQLANHGAIRHEGDQTRTEDREWYIHSKTAVRDHRDVMVGSFNLDARSYAVNIEETTVIENCPDLARDIEIEYLILAKYYYEDVATCPSCFSVEDPPTLPIKIFGAFGRELF